jgi:hypothetical protein
MSNYIVVLDAHLYFTVDADSEEMAQAEINNNVTVDALYNGMPTTFGLDDVPVRLDNVEKDPAVADMWQDDEADAEAEREREMST